MQGIDFVEDKMTLSPPDKPKKKPAAKKAVSSALNALDKDIEYLERVGEEEIAFNPARQPGRLNTAPENDLGKRLHETRESMRLTQGDLANLTKSLDADEKGISRAVISLYEAGTNRPSPREIRLLCESLRVTPNYLIYGDDNPFDELSDYERLGTLTRKDPEGFAWMAYVMSIIHHNHYDAVMKLVLDLARGFNTGFDQGIQEKANANLIKMAKQLQEQLEKQKRLTVLKK